MATTFTPKTLPDALAWIHTHAHHEIGTLYKGSSAKAERIGTYYANYHTIMRVMDKHDWAKQFHAMTQPNPRPHDDRMFALTRKGKVFLGQQEISAKIDWKIHP